MNLQGKLIEKKNLFFTKKNIYLFLLAIAIFAFDRFTKIKILNDFSDSVFFINGLINIDLIWNTGIGFGLFSTESSTIYNLVTILICLVILVLFYTAVVSTKSDGFIFSIIIGGALGNVYDRLIFNAVPDFIDLHYNNFHWFTFNLADIFITLGIIAFLMKGFFIKK
mgnify:FL=1|jgi:signal peptidase II